MDQKLEKSYKRIFPRCIEWLFPSLCAGCEREGTWLCGACAVSAQSPGIQRIVVGKQKIVVTSLATYAVAPVKTALWRFKYQSIRAYGDVLTDVLIGNLPKNYCNDRVLVPIPLSPWRLRWRGYNQAQLFAHACGTHRGAEVYEGLIRVHRARPQVTTTDKLQRIENVKGVFALSHDSSTLHGRHICIVDDVVTTGATIAEAARILSRARPASITALTIARDV